MKEEFYSGFASLIGVPNVGKSTLMNKLIGEKVAIMSSKPQTTRNKIQAILTKEDFQLIFIDTPGIHKPKSKLGVHMIKEAETTLNEVDIILYLIEPFEKIKDTDLNIIKKLSTAKAPVFLIINKIDKIPYENVLKIIQNYKDLYNFAEVIPLSALKNKNIDILLTTLKKYLKKGPMFFPEDMITNQPEKQIVAEIIREKALHILQEEVPHGLAVEINRIKKRTDKNLLDINATIYCEKDSHKGIIIGKKGDTLKKIASNARYELELMFKTQINLQIWVKVKKNWRDNDFLLKNFGYN